MTFEIPDGLAPEAYPLAWLLGTWRGPGFLAYPDIPQRAVLTEAEFSHDGGPYLAYAATTWLLESPLDSLEGEIDVAAMQTGQVWSTERGFWRIAPTAPDDASSLAEGAQDTQGTPGAQNTPGAAQNAPEEPVPPNAATETALEVLLTEPSGHVSVFLGTASGPRVELSTDLVARTATGVEISAATRMYGLVGGELFWASDLAAFGHELQSYSSGRMQRQN